MKKSIVKLKLFTLILLILPFFCGCRGGGGSADSGSVGNAGAGGSSGAGFEVGDISRTLPPVGDDIATIHNPEPASMLLFGTGMMAMGFYRKRRNQSLK